MVKDFSRSVIYLSEASCDEQNLPHDDAENDDLTPVFSLTSSETGVYMESGRR